MSIMDNMKLLEQIADCLIGIGYAELSHAESRISIILGSCKLLKLDEDYVMVRGDGHSKSEK